MARLEDGWMVGARLREEEVLRRLAYILLKRPLVIARLAIDSRSTRFLPAHQ